MKKFLLAFGVILALAFSVTAATTDFNTTHNTTITDGGCDKCNNKDCKGDCDAKGSTCNHGENKACCKKDDKKAASCCHKGESKKACTGKGEGKSCHKKGETKKACTGKGEAKKSCGHH